MQKTFTGRAHAPEPLDWQFDDTHCRSTELSRILYAIETMQMGQQPGR
jgi:hypothetical protein